MHFSRGCVSGSSTQELVAYLTVYQCPLGNEAIQQESHCLGACAALLPICPPGTHKGQGATRRQQRDSSCWTLMATSLSGLIFVAATAQHRTKRSLLWNTEHEIAHLRRRGKAGSEKALESYSGRFKLRSKSQWQLPETATLLSSWFFIT